jgi:tetratricopeptide (TPR) repeat protein
VNSCPRTVTRSGLRNADGSCGRRISLLLGLARLYEERADYDSAAEALRRVVSEESIREEAHLGLMRLYALLGRKAEALAQYELLEDILSSKDPGIEPAASSRALREEIAAARFPPKDARYLGFPPEEPLGVSKHNLPAPRTSFVGRGREIVEVKRALAMTRLLTLTGAVGQVRRGSPWRSHGTSWVPSQTGCGWWSWLLSRRVSWCRKR